MKDTAKMRLAVLKELKNVKHFFTMMENGVKSRDPSRIYPAYLFLENLVYHMNEGDLTPLSIELKQELLNAEYNNTSRFYK